MLPPYCASSGIACAGDAFGLGIILTGLFVVISLLLWLWVFAWAWIDDAKPGDSLMSKLVRKFWKIKSRDDTWLGYLWMMLIVIFSPSVVTLVAFYPAFFISVGCLVAIAFTARYGRRLHKKFMAHVEDKDAHKS